MAEMGKRLGFSGIGIVRYYSEKMEPVYRVDGVDIVSCVMIKAQNPEEMNRAIRAARDKTEIVMVHGGNYGINRAACENPMVDILCHPELGRRDSGLDHICAKAAHENRVAVEINFREILESHRKNRSYVMSSIKRNVMLLVKYEACIVATSGAVSVWGMRSGRELASVAHLMGMDLGAAIASASGVQEDIVRINREKLAGKRWEGVRIDE